MKKFLSWFLPVAVLLAAMGCSKEHAASDRYEFDAEWAAAYYYGTDAQGGIDSFQLDLAQGRTDADLDLISSGAVVRLIISAPAAGEITLPDGVYRGSDSRETAYTFNYGTMQADKTVSGSYVGLRHGNGKQTQILPVERGHVSVQINDEGLYAIHAELVTGSKTVTFMYHGTVRTFNCTDPE